MDNEEIRKLLQELKETSDESTSVRSKVVKIHFDTPAEAERRRRAKKKAEAEKARKQAEEEARAAAEEEARALAAEKAAQEAVEAAKKEAKAGFADIDEDLYPEENDIPEDEDDLDLNWDYDRPVLKSGFAREDAFGPASSGKDEKGTDAEGAENADDAGGRKDSGKGSGGANEEGDDFASDEDEFRSRDEADSITGLPGLFGSIADRMLSFAGGVKNSVKEDLSKVRNSRKNGGDADEAGSSEDPDGTDAAENSHDFGDAEASDQSDQPAEMTDRGSSLDAPAYDANETGAGMDTVDGPDAIAEDTESADKASELDEEWKRRMEEPPRRKGFFERMKASMAASSEVRRTGTAKSRPLRSRKKAASSEQADVDEKADAGPAPDVNEFDAAPEEGFAEGPDYMEEAGADADKDLGSAQSADYMEETGARAEKDYESAQGADYMEEAGADADKDLGSAESADYMEEAGADADKDLGSAESADGMETSGVDSPGSVPGAANAQSGAGMTEGTQETEEKSIEVIDLNEYQNNKESEVIPLTGDTGPLPEPSVLKALKARMQKDKKPGAKKPKKPKHSGENESGPEKKSSFSFRSLFGGKKKKDAADGADAGEMQAEESFEASGDTGVDEGFETAGDAGLNGLASGNRTAGFDGIDSGVDEADDLENDPALEAMRRISFAKVSPDRSEGKMTDPHDGGMPAPDADEKADPDLDGAEAFEEELIGSLQADTADFEDPEKAGAAASEKGASIRSLLDAAKTQGRSKRSKKTTKRKSVKHPAGEKRLKTLPLLILVLVLAAVAIVLMLLLNGAFQVEKTRQAAITQDEGMTVQVLSQPEEFAKEGDIRLSVKAPETIQSVTVNGESVVIDPAKSVEFTYHATGGTLDVMAVSTDKVRSAKVILAYVDSQPPTITIHEAEGKIELKAEDTESGLDSIYVGSVNGVSDIPKYSKYTEPLDMDPDKMISYYATDQAGNSSTPASAALTPAQSLAFEWDSYNLYPGAEKQLKLVTTPENAFVDNLTLEAENPKVVQIEGGNVIKGVSEGDTKLIATADGIAGTTASVSVMSERKVRISAIGDCTIGTEMSFDQNTSLNAYQAMYGNSYFFEKVKTILSSDDSTFANFEGTLTTSDQRGNKIYAFKGDPSFTQILTEGSIDAVTLANNHIDDYGEQGILDTQNALEDAGIVWCRDEHIGWREVNGIRIAYIGIYALENGMSTLEQVKSTINTSKEGGADLIVVEFHWGAELVEELDEYQTALAHAAVDEGANLVLGSHAHVLQAIEKYNGAYIVYGLGNFCFGGNTDPSSDDTMIWQQTFTFTADGLANTDDIAIIPCQVSSDTSINNYQPIPVSGEAAERIMNKIDSLSAQFGQSYSQYMVDGTLWTEPGQQ